MLIHKRICSILLLLCLLVPIDVHAEVVVTNLQQTEDNLSMATVRAIFFMRLTQWQNGTPITVFVLKPQNPIHARFCENVLGVFPYQLQRSWDRLVYSGTGQSPIFVDTEEQLKRRVSATVGAIGYVSEGALDDTIKPIAFH